MKTLLILRHAKSSWKDPDLEDHDRPLNRRGKRDAPRMGRLVRRLGLLPGLIVSSTAERARLTAMTVARHCAYRREILFRRELYLADSRSLVRTIRQINPGDVERMMIVGHNPGLEELVERLTGAEEALPTAALAWIELRLERWSDLRLVKRGRLVGVWRPKALDDQAS